ncbi:MAG: hypothetical protein A6F71_10335 [Cycloclasticus sp. symbiont of Poecilosclerida sp. M]|nr:MAG: hypothetical protein A6F71_10335 [Cycloclasticus sp. symbiont of Poecilosclerida sp. M]
MQKDGDSNLRGTTFGLDKLHKHILGKDIEGKRRNYKTMLISYITQELTGPYQTSMLWRKSSPIPSWPAVSPNSSFA